MYSWKWAWDEFSFTIALVIGALLVGFHLPKRRRFVLRAAICSVILICFVFCWSALVQYLRTLDLGDMRRHIRLPGFFIQFLLVIFSMHACFDCNFWVALFCGTVAYCLQHLSYRIFAILELEFSSAFDLYLVRIVVLTAITSALYIVVYFLAVNDNKYAYSKIMVDGKLQLISAASVVLISIVFNMLILGEARGYGAKNIILYNYIISGISMIIALMLEFSIFNTKKSQNDLSELKQLLHEKKEQYEIEKANVDQINIKFHDLRHQISAIENKLDKTEMKEISDTISLYDSFVETGNDAIDVVLTQKSFYCQKHNIKMTCLLNGKNYDFIPPHELYALFGNAIENAIHAVEKLEPEKRVISIAESSHGNFVKVRIINYFSGDIAFSGGLPVTQKNKNYHGFGMKSMKMLTEKYGGRMSAHLHGELFTLEFFLPFNYGTKH